MFDRQQYDPLKDALKRALCGPREAPPGQADMAPNDALAAALERLKELDAKA